MPRQFSSFLHQHHHDLHHHYSSTSTQLPAHPGTLSDPCQPTLLTTQYSLPTCHAPGLTLFIPLALLLGLFLLALVVLFCWLPSFLYKGILFPFFFLFVSSGPALEDLLTLFFFLFSCLDIFSYHYYKDSLVTSLVTSLA